VLTPVVDEDGAPFWEYAARGELRIQACADCGELRFPPRPCCPHCRSFAAEWRLMSGRGRIWSYVVPHPPLLPDYAEQAPYNAVLVELADAPRIRLRPLPRHRSSSHSAPPASEAGSRTVRPTARRDPRVASCARPRRSSAHEIAAIEKR